MAQQTTTSLRSVLGAALDTSIPIGSERALGLTIRLGWQHEYADTGAADHVGVRRRAVRLVHRLRRHADARCRHHRPGGDDQHRRRGAALPRYDGELGSGTDNHALTAGLRMNW